MPKCVFQKARTAMAIKNLTFVLRRSSRRIRIPTFSMMKLDGGACRTIGGGIFPCKLWLRKFKNMWKNSSCIIFCEGWFLTLGSLMDHPRTSRITKWQLDSSTTCTNVQQHQIVLKMHVDDHQYAITRLHFNVVTPFAGDLVCDNRIVCQETLSDENGSSFSVVKVPRKPKLSV